MLRRKFPNVSHQGHLREGVLSHDNLAEAITIWRVKADLSESCSHLFQKPEEGPQAEDTGDVILYSCPWQHDTLDTFF